MKNLLKIAVLSAALSCWYSTAEQQQIPITQRYEMPKTITVQNISTSRAKFKNEKNSLEKIVDTDKIDFSKPFDITTPRYRIINDEDSAVSRAIGAFGSIPSKILLFDKNMGYKPDEERAKAILSMLENDKSIKGITVRLGHNRVIYDTWRLFTDEHVTNRNSIVPRASLGLISMILSEPIAELFRADYYNPMTQTVVIYSNIESVGAHEIGHHKDFQRFDRDWAYALASSFPPVRLYKEYAASKNAANLLAQQDQQQVYRYLFPAFMTYLAAGWQLSRQVLQKRKASIHPNIEDAEKQAIETFEVAHFIHDMFRKHEDINEIPKKARPHVPVTETLRLFLHQNIILASAIGAYSLTSDFGPGAAASSFAAGMLASDYLCDLIGDRIAPYEHEQKKMMTRRVAASAYRISKRSIENMHLRNQHTGTTKYITLKLSNTE